MEHSDETARGARTDTPSDDKLEAGRGKRMMEARLDLDESLLELPEMRKAAKTWGEDAVTEHIVLPITDWMLTDQGRADLMKVFRGLEDDAPAPGNSPDARRPEPANRPGDAASKGAPTWAAKRAGETR